MGVGFFGSRGRRSVAVGLAATLIAVGFLVRLGRKRDAADAETEDENEVFHLKNWLVNWCLLVRFSTFAPYFLLQQFRVSLLFDCFVPAFGRKYPALEK